jgi:uncharacterized membrane protein
MDTRRLEAFSDGVMAIIITIMVLELKVPHEASLQALGPLLPDFLTYILSYIYLGIYWNNHHHLLHATQQVSGGILWANLYLLFWLSLIPFVTGWMGENHFEPGPTALYGVVLLMAGMAYTLLQRAIVARHGRDSILGVAIGADMKGNLSLVFYLVAIAFSYVSVWIATTSYVAVALMWLVPDRRIERALADRRAADRGPHGAG